MLPPLDDAHPLPEATLRSFREHGHVLVRGLASPDEIAAPGDASSRAGWTLHRAPANRTERMREVMAIIYFADGTRAGSLDHPNRRFDRDVRLAGCDPGEPAAGPLNPVLGRRGA